MQGAAGWLDMYLGAKGCRGQQGGWSGSWVPRVAEGSRVVGKVAGCQGLQRAAGWLKW